MTCAGQTYGQYQLARPKDLGLANFSCNRVIYNLQGVHTRHSVIAYSLFNGVSLGHVNKSNNKNNNSMLSTDSEHH